MYDVFDYSLGVVSPAKINSIYLIILKIRVSSLNVLSISNLGDVIFYTIFQYFN